MYSKKRMQEDFSISYEMLINILVANEITPIAGTSKYSPASYRRLKQIIEGETNAG